MEKEWREVEEQVESLMSGQGSEVTGCDVCPEQCKPASLKKNVTYIVCAVIFNEKEEVLMVQEARQDCYKQWYLPAGRVEVGESLEEAMRREVKEEAGFDCEPITLLLIQEQGPQWIRFNFLAKITGGSLKNLTAADQESLQACWWDRKAVLPLRGRDIIRIIDCGLKYCREPWHPVTLPLDLRCRHVVQRSVLVFTNSANKIWLLLIKGLLHHSTRFGSKSKIIIDTIPPPSSCCPRAPPPRGCCSEDPRCDLGGQHAGAGSDAVVVLRP
ncbi:8-oxo-dGDP phosphatase NUDT18 isoform X3 [Eleginops maclovinus]|uniref:8-oxo-dGDP phosphatase NUDT18 isoform X3 n=1 Tax=Eleginops maclovinus TaxID=56733 RepID=UPI0030810009